RNPIKSTMDVMTTTCLVCCCMCVRVMSAYAQKLLVASFYFFDKCLGWLEGRYIVRRDNDGGVLRYITRSLFCPFLYDKTTEAPNINILTPNHRIFYNLEESLNRFLNVHFL